MIVNNGIDIPFNHRLPLRFAISVGVPISKHIELETGLSYSLLYSEFTPFVGHGTQQLSFLGIPLGLSGTMWENDRFRVYAGAGGMAEWMVDGAVTSNNVRKQLNDSHPYYSLYGHGGFGIKFTPWLDLGIEPGVQYYFPRTEYPTHSYYSDHPLSFALRVSLNFRL